MGRIRKTFKNKMKILPVLVLSLFCSTQAISQNKKEQIEQLTYSKDSLQYLIDKERNISSEKIKELEEKIALKKEGIISLNKLIESKQNELNEKKVIIENYIVSELELNKKIKNQDDSLLALKNTINTQLEFPSFIIPNFFKGNWVMNQNDCAGFYTEFDFTLGKEIEKDDKNLWYIDGGRVFYYSCDENVRHSFHYYYYYDREDHFGIHEMYLNVISENEIHIGNYFDHNDKILDAKIYYKCP
jgi:hypothetical protein